MAFSDFFRKFSNSHFLFQSPICMRGILQGPLTVQGRCIEPLGCGTTATRHPVSAWILVIWSPPRPMIIPTIASGTGNSSVVKPATPGHIFIFRNVMKLSLLSFLKYSKKSWPNWTDSIVKLRRRRRVPMILTLKSATSSLGGPLFINGCITRPIVEPINIYRRVGL